MIRRIGDERCQSSSTLISPTIPLLYDVTRGSPDDEFQEYLCQKLAITADVH